GAQSSWTRRSDPSVFEKRLPTLSSYDRASPIGVTSEEHPMNSHVSAILLGVNDMERSKHFYVDGLGWRVQNDYKISVFFVPHGGSLVGFYGREGLADMVGASQEGSGFSGLVLNYVVRSEARVDEVREEAQGG